VWACALSPDGQQLVSGSWDHTLKLWEVASGRELRTFAGHKAGVWACALSPDGQQLVSGSADNTLKLWAVASGRVLATIRLPWTPCGLAWSTANPHHVFSANLNGTVTVFDLDAFGQK
jgi:WD40 repeat protein